MIIAVLGEKGGTGKTTLQTVGKRFVSQTVGRMDWTMHEGYGIPIGSSAAHGSPQEVSPVSFPLHLSSFPRKQLYRRLQPASGSGDLRVVNACHP